MNKRTGWIPRLLSLSFNKGDLGDSKEWLEWDHVATVISLLKKKLDDLKNLKYEC